MTQKSKGIIGHEEAAAHEAWTAARNQLAAARRGFWTEVPETAQSRLRGGTSNGRKYASAWPGIVRTCHASGVSAVDAIACLASWWTAEQLPQVWDIVRQENLALLKDRQARLRPNLTINLTSELNLLLAQLDFYLRAYADRREARRRTIADPGLAVSPLLRFAAAVLYEVPELAAAQRPAAQAQYAQHPELYRELWASVLTPAVLHALEG